MARLSRVAGLERGSFVRRCGAAAALLAVLAAAGCQSSGATATPSGSGPRLRLVDVAEKVVYAGPGGAATRYPAARIAVTNPTGSAVRIVSFEAVVGRGRSEYATAQWSGADDLPRDGGKVYLLPLREHYVASAQAAIDAGAPQRLARWKVTYDDLGGVRRVALYP